MFMCSLKCFENKGCEEPKIAFSFSDIINNPVSYTHLTLPTICSV